MLSVSPPFTLRAAGLAGAALLLGVAALARGSGLLPPRAAWPGIAISSLLNVAIFNLASAFAQLHTSTSRAAVLTYVMPVITVVLAWPLLGERPTRRAWIAVALGAAGIGLLAWPALTSGASRAGSWIGVLLPLVGASSWAAGTLVSKRWPLEGDRLLNLAWQLVIGAAVAATGAWLAGERPPGPIPPAVLATFAFHVVIAMAAGYGLWFMLLERADAGVSAMTTLAVPVVGVAGAMLLAGERPGALDWPGFAAVLAGAALVMRPPAGR
ncbi:MAG: EamA family transporter [Rubrivivax sp.]|nr:EamA family transporter [Rubrivivax sp.]